MVCGPLPQDGQRSLGALPTLSRKLLRDEQQPERSWDSVVRYGRGREDSSGATGGAAAPRTVLSGREATAWDTASVWREGMMCRYVSGGMVPTTMYSATR